MLFVCLFVCKELVRCSCMIYLQSDRWNLIMLISSQRRFTWCFGKRSEGFAAATKKIQLSARRLQNIRLLRKSKKDRIEILQLPSRVGASSSLTQYC